MNRTATILGSMTAAAGAMYFLDPNQGRRRRAVVRDRMMSAAGDSGALLRKAGRDLGNRATGTAANVRSLLRFRRETPPDDVIVARVRTAIGRCISHPGAIHVSSEEGSVKLHGLVEPDEKQRLLRAVRSVRGVREIQDQLEISAEAGNGRRRSGGVPEFLQVNWTPAVRVMATIGGGALAAYGLTRGNAAGLIPGILGAGLVTRAVTNLDSRRLTGAGAGRRALDFQKTVTIHAPVDEVFRVWSNYENFPRFMRHLREVRDHGGGRSHWVAEGPLGSSVAWDAEITQFDRNKLLSWKSLPGSRIENAGVIRFDTTPEGYTRVHMRLSYNPPAGALGHAVAWLFGRDLKTELDEDMVRLKSLLERGKTRASSGETITRADLEPVPGLS